MYFIHWHTSFQILLDSIVYPLYHPIVTTLYDLHEIFVNSSTFLLKDNQDQAIEFM